MMLKKALFVLFTLLPLLAGCGGGGGGTGTTDNTANTNDDLSAPPQILSFSPVAGDVGTNVQISGILFSSSPVGNNVRFNGVDAPVLSATEMEIVVSVPAGAASGPLSVTTSAGTATTVDTFTVLDSTTPGVAWTTRTTGLRESPSGIAWDGSKYVVAGDSILTSTDIVRWEERKVFAWLYDLQWNGKRFVGVGNFGHILTSTDGLTWTQTNGSGDLYGIAHSDTLWVAVGDGGAILTSPDGLIWTSRISPVNGDLNDVAWSGSQFVAVGSDGAVITSTDGINWAEQTSGVTDSFTAVAATPSLMVASTFPYPSSTSAVYTSVDGVDWIQQATGIGSFNDIIYAGGQWVGVGSYTVAHSTDGASWSVSSNAPSNPIGFLQAVTYDGSQYVAVGDWEGSVYTSPDAITWSLRAAEQELRAVARRPSDGRLVAVATSKVSMVSADDGVSWQFGGLDTMTGNLFLDVEWFAPLNAFVALVQVGANEDIYTSTDGLAWTELGYAPLNGRLGASDTRLVSVGWDLVKEGISTSTDGVTWTAVYTSTADKSLQEVFWSGSQFIAVGESGAIITSANGTSWTAQTSGVTETLYAAAASPSHLVAVGASGTVVASADNGVTWTQQSSGTTYTLYSVAWTGAEFVAVGSHGRAVRSTDGLNWSLQPTPYTDVLFGSDPFHLKSIVWAGNSDRLVTIGTRGLVATSP